MSVVRPRRERFVFGVPLISRAGAADWGRVGQLLGLTLRSVLAQTDADFRLLLAGHDVPESWTRLTSGDARFRFLRADWPPQAPSAANDDSGAKKWMIGEHVRRSGGGLLMYLDADDLVDRRLVAAARAETNPAMRPRHIGAVVAHGLVIDHRTLRAVSLPHPRVYDGPFVELCGSSTIARIEPDSPDPARRDPHAALGSHHRWPSAAAEAGLPLASLLVTGGYLVNTAQNHSELHGPFADWRRRLNAAVAREGRPLDRAAAAVFGLDPAFAVT